MNTSDFELKTYQNDLYESLTEQIRGMGSEFENIVLEPETADVLETINATPLGKLLSIISSLPEIRHEKVSNVREQIDRGQYDLGDNLDIALDRVLEEFIVE